MRHLTDAVILSTLTACCNAGRSMTGYLTTRSQDMASCASQMDGKLPQPISPGFKFSGNVRKYYIAAEEELWNYAPTGWDNWLGLPLQQSPRAKSVGYLDYGTSWMKGLYRGYTDSSFSKRSPQAAWQGTQGPTIRAEQNDMIEIIEGSDYPNTTYPDQPFPLPAADAVPPGSCVVYKWLVNGPEGPQPGEPARIHVYHSYVAYQQDINAGLIGPTIIYAPGQMQSTMSNYREFTLLYTIYDENQSWLSAQNKARLDKSSGKRAIDDSTELTQSRQDQSSDIVTHQFDTSTASNASYWYPQLVNYNSSQQFSSAPSFHTMNGYVYANNPTFNMCFQDQVIWYVYSYASESHVFHMHGNGFTSDGVQMDAISLDNGVMKTLYMNATDIGQWYVLCHVADHMDAGMVSIYRVQPSHICSA